MGNISCVFFFTEGGTAWIENVWERRPVAGTLARPGSGSGGGGDEAPNRPVIPRGPFDNLGPFADGG